MQAQSVILDLLKPVGTVVDLSDKFNARVGDSMTPFNLFITEGGKPKVLNGLHPELEAVVGNGALKGNKAIMAAGAKGVHWVGSTNCVTGYNQLTLAFPAEVFPQSGFCYGHLILANDAGVRESSVDIWFKVLDGTPLMGLVADHYDSELQLELAKAKNANDQFSQEMRDTYNQQVTDAQNALTRATSDLSHLSESVGAVQAQINADNVITRAEFLDVKDAVKTELSNISTTPETFGSVDALKAKYPDGETRLAIVANNDGANFYYYDSATQTWTEGSSFLNTDGIQISEAIESHENYIPNSSFTTSELPETTQEATGSPFAVVKSVGTLFPGRKCIHLEVSGNGGIVYTFDPANQNYQDFENHDKRFGCLLKNDSGEVRPFSIQLIVMNGDNLNELRTYTIDNRNIEPAKLYQILFDFSLPLPKFYVHTVYQIRIIHDDTKTGVFDVAMPCLQDIYTKLNHDDNTLIESGDDVENWNASQILSEARPNGSWYHVLQKDYNNASDVGIAWHKTIGANTFQNNTKLKLSTTLSNDTDFVKAINFQLWETDQNLSPLYQNNIKTVVMLPHTEMSVNEVSEIVPNTSATKVILMAMEQNTQSADFYISRKTRVDFVSNSQTVNDNLLGDYRRNTYASGGTTMLDNYNGISAIHINFPDTGSWPQCVMPFTASQVGIYEAHLKLVSQSAQVLPLQLKRFLADGSGQVVANYRSINLKANTPKTIDFDVQITDTTGLYQALLLYMEKGPADFQILEASLKPKTIEIDSGTNNLPTFNLIAPLDESGALTKGFVEIGRGNVINRYPATFKTQGNSTKLFPKKSWRITFYTADDYQTKQQVNIFPDYPAVDSLNMKANYIDWTQANNILVSQYIADMTQLTHDVDVNQRHANNQCQITGEPVLGFNNGQKLGLFTISPKKSNDMFNMTKGNQNQAVFEGNKGDGAIRFKADSAAFEEDKDFSIEAPDDNVSQAVKDSFNSLLKLTNSGTDEEFKTKIGDKLNLRSVANWIVMLSIFGLEDDIAKNVCWATWDGIKWNAVMYDHDLAWGMVWDGSGLTGAARDDVLQDYMNRNKLVSRLIHLHIIDDLLIDSFTKFSQAHNWLSIQQRFRQYYYWIGESNYVEDKALWPKMPSQYWMPASYVLNYIRVRMELCAKWFTPHYLAKL
ncbi:hypothetical protein CP361_06300 [Lactobacillus sp. UMNPBX10]|nr:hypothetical protein CP361_06300 [Lactobacillus sp. UMNPBX10]